MRGFPFLNLLIALLLSGSVLLPLVYRATRVVASPLEPAGPDVETQHGGEISSNIRLHFSHAPLNVHLKNGEVILHEWKSPGVRPPGETVMLPFSDNCTEFTLQAAWPAGTPETVIEITVEPDGKAARFANVWSSGAAADALVTLTWEGMP